MPPSGPLPLLATTTDGQPPPKLFLPPATPPLAPSVPPSRSCCVQCGRVLEDTAFSADVTFQKDAGGESTVVGQFVSETGVARGVGRIHGGRVYAYQVGRRSGVCACVLRALSWALASGGCSEKDQHMWQSACPASLALPPPAPPLRRPTRTRRRSRGGGRTLRTWWTC